MKKILAVDYGDARTGLATSDPLGLLASAAGVIEGRRAEVVADLVAEEAKRLGAATILLGYPKNMDGSEGAV